MTKWLDINAFMGIPALDWVYAIVATLLGFVILTYLLRFVIDRAQVLARSTRSRHAEILVDVLRGTSKSTLFVAALIIGAKFLPLTERWDSRLDHLWFLVIGFQFALWINRGVGIWTARRLAATGDVIHNPVITTMTAWTLRALLWSILLLAVLANMGVNITAFVASLGVGGVAVALAVQSILSDLFASLAIGLDKPFELGDFVVFNDIAGSIEHIGLKTTRIRSLSGEQIVCGNTELLKNTLHNYKRMNERRILFTFGVSYDARPEQLRQVPEMIRQAVAAAGDTRFDRAHFKGFGTQDLTYEVVYYVTDPSYNLYMDVQQKVNLDIMEGLERLGLAFALPIRNVRVVRQPRGEAGRGERQGGNEAAPQRPVMMGPAQPTTLARRTG